jgi:adenylate cyclase, class 2
MPRELEVKIRLADAPALRTCLRQRGARCLGMVHETNHILDSPDARLRQQGCVLRVRAARSDQSPAETAITLTLKGARAAELAAAGIKSREELEISAGNEPVLLGILARLGFCATLCYEKRRETWRLDECLVTLDELPNLGWFAEIEGPTVEAIRAAQAALALRAAAVAAETYVELTARHGREEPGGLRALRFDQAGAGGR